MQPLIDTENLQILRRPGDGDVVMAFAGVQGRFGGIPETEFAASLAQAAPNCEAIFVIDKTRGWYKDTAGQIVEILAPLGFGRRVVTLGNSMGGYGALLFGERLGAAVSVAFCPQYALGLPFETRWEGACPPCLSETPNSGQRLVFIGQHAADQAHARLIFERMAPGDAVYTIEGCRHDVAPFLKQNNMLIPILRDVLAGRQLDLPYALWRR